MQSVAFAVRLLPGQTEVVRIALASCWVGARKEAYQDARRRAGIIREAVWIQPDVLDEPDVLVEIADWESAQARDAHMKNAAATGVYAPLPELLAGPFRATVISQRPGPPNHASRSCSR